MLQKPSQQELPEMRISRSLTTDKQQIHKLPSPVSLRTLRVAALLTQKLRTTVRMKDSLSLTMAVESQSIVLEAPRPVTLTGRKWLLREIEKTTKVPVKKIWDFLL
jgi:hypothetical protein